MPMFTAHFWTLLTLLVLAGAATTVVATLTAEAAVDRMRRRRHRAQLHPLTGPPSCSPHRIHH